MASITYNSLGSAASGTTPRSAARASAAVGEWLARGSRAVSYTHLDVYKSQGPRGSTTLVTIGALAKSADPGLAPALQAVADELSGGSTGAARQGAADRK